MGVGKTWRERGRGMRMNERKKERKIDRYIYIWREEFLPRTNVCVSCNVHMRT